MKQMIKNPDKLKCCICKKVMDKTEIAIGEYTYKCKNKECVTYETDEQAQAEIEINNKLDEAERQYNKDANDTEASRLEGV